MNLLVRAYGAAGMLARPWLRAMLRRRTGRDKELPGRIQERFGVSPLPRPAGRLVWLHAASVGEMMSVRPVIALLVKKSAVLLTTGTVTSAKLAEENLPAVTLGEEAEERIQGAVQNFIEPQRPAELAADLQHHPERVPGIRAIFRCVGEG